MPIASSQVAAWRSRRPLAVIRGALRIYMARREHYRAARSLHALSDDLLKDMGISRCEIPVAVRGMLADPEGGHEDDAV